MHTFQYKKLDVSISLCVIVLSENRKFKNIKYFTKKTLCFYHIVMCNQKALKLSCYQKTLSVCLVVKFVSKPLEALC